MATMEELFSSAGIPWVELDPRDQFGAYTTQQFRPGPSPAREAFWGMRSPLMQQYYLEQPRMISPGQEYGSFSDYMNQMGVEGYAQPTADELGIRARRAAAMAGLTPGQFAQYVSPLPSDEYQGLPISADVRGLIEKLSPAQQLMYRQTYGTGQEAQQNQLELANLLALQRTQGGMYGGQYGAAVTSALNELSQQFQARDPNANFLDWYLERTKGFPSGIGASGLTQQD